MEMQAAPGRIRNTSCGPSLQSSSAPSAAFLLGDKVAEVYFTIRFPHWKYDVPLLFPCWTTNCSGKHMFGL